ncbi:MAG: oligosaccharide flippase family protein [Halobacteriota archaeon]
MVISLIFFISAFATVKVAPLQKGMDFRTLAAAQLTAAVLSGGKAIFLTFSGLACGASYPCTSLIPSCPRSSPTPHELRRRVPEPRVPRTIQIHCSGRYPPGSLGARFLTSRFDGACVRVLLPVKLCRFLCDGALHGSQPAPV